MSKTMSSLTELPDELLIQVLQHLLHPNPCSETNAGMHPAILGVNHYLYDLGTQVLHKAPGMRQVLYRAPEHINKSTPSPSTTQIPPKVVRQLSDLTVSMTFWTTTRGECAINFWGTTGCSMRESVECFAIILLGGCSLQRLHVELLNGYLRKTGARSFKANDMRRAMRRVLVSLAYLPRKVDIIVEGFDTFEYGNDFVAMRDRFAGQSLPWDEYGNLLWWQGLEAMELAP